MSKPYNKIIQSVINANKKKKKMVNQQEFFNFVSRYLDDPKITISEYQRRNLNCLIDAMSGGQTYSDSSDSTDSAVGEEELKGGDEPMLNQAQFVIVFKQTLKEKMEGRSDEQWIALNFATIMNLSNKHRIEIGLRKL